MKKTPLLFSLLGFCLLLQAQTTFQRTYGGSGNEQAHAIVATQDGGYALAGLTTSFGSGESDLFILKVSSEGVVQWQKTYGGVLNELGLGVAMLESPDGGLVVTGMTDEENVSRSDLYLFKVDSEGNLLWDFTYDSGPNGNSGDHGRGLLNTANGDILAFGTDDANSFGSNDGIIIRTDSKGNLKWKNVYGGTSNDHLHQAIELSGGNILVCGSSQSFGPGITAGYLLKISPDGNLIWANVYGGNANDGFNSCDITSDQNIIVTGIATSFGAGNADVILSKIDTSGNVIWTKTFGGEGSERAGSVKALADGSGFFVTAYTNSYGNGSMDILLIRTNADGDIIWSKTFGTQGFERVEANCLELTEDQGLAIAGWSDSLGVSGEDIVFIKSDENGNTLCQEVNVETNSPTVTAMTTATEVASPGTYSSAISTVSSSSMIGKEICYCIESCHQCEQAVVHYDLNACYSNLDDGSNMNYSEFIPSYPTELSFAFISASSVHRENAVMNKHSCTPGVEDSPAMCVSSLNSCTYDAGNALSVVFELTVLPVPDSSVQISSLSFYEKAPIMYNWINGASGLNNYPTRYGIRVLKDGIEIFRQDNIATTIDVWSHEIFEFSNDDAFIAEDTATFRFELLAYCVIGNISQVNAWDLDEISVSVSCDPVTGASNNISGYIRNAASTPLGNVDILLSHDPVFQSSTANTTTDLAGQYTFKQIRADHNLYIKGYNNSDFLNGVTTLDLIHIQKHLLGLEQLTSPYQLIAADANRSNSVSALDIHRLRSLILGRITELPGNTSWRFVDANQKLSINNPWNCQEICEVPNIGVDIGNAHFVGIKVGDVTFDAETMLHASTENQKHERALQLKIKEQYLIADEPTIIEITSAELKDLMGFQFALQCSGLEILGVHSSKLSLAEEHAYVTETGTLSISWNAPNARSIDESDMCLQLLVLPQRSGFLSEMLQLNVHGLDPVAYHDVDLKISRIELEFYSHELVNTQPRHFIAWNAPNPFSKNTTLHFTIEKAEIVLFRFYDMSGRLLHNDEGNFTAGEHMFNVAQQDLGVSEGTIICHIIAADKSEVCKMILAE